MQKLVVIEGRITERHSAVPVTVCHGKTVLERRVTHYDVDIPVVNYNTANLLPEMFAARAAAVDDKICDVLVVDNASTDTSAAVLK